MILTDYGLLKEAGIDIDTFMKRLMGNEALVKVFVTKFIQDKTMDSLRDAMKSKDMQKAEVASHTLKGMCGNMSIDSLFTLFSTQVNCIRSGEGDKAEAMMDEICEKYDNAISYMKQWLEI